jgi:Fuc2NAc and GlcNAc transferase
MSLVLVAGLAACVVTLGLTGFVRRFALAHGLLDVPNERSSHRVPVPRGGGLAIVVVVLAGVAVLEATQALAAGVGPAILGGGGLVALVGWLDDRRGLSPATRLAAHALAAAWALWWLGGMPSLTTGAGAVQLGLPGTLLAAGAILWATNITNFMDGIDGLAAGEAATVTLTAASLLAGANPPLAALAALVGGAALGFLPWNWSPARIFMGDVGSGFLGFVLAVLAISSERAGALPALVWLLLYAVFAFDATVTLIRRGWRGERWYAAHRSHAYQRAVQSGWTHARVTTGVLAMNAGLGLVAWAVTERPHLLGVALLAAAGGCWLLYAAVEARQPMPPAAGAATGAGVDNSPG